ncbi:MAG: helicase C-terminal domain-containing protein [Synechococcales bacterium]|nr:helicase C-terminal domain-containing protein [Synechococcales bacterium]
MIEAEVHQHLRAFLREQPTPHWSHHLTMARLVARALRLGRSALIQTGTLTGFQAPYRLSYLLPLLLWPGSALLVTLPEVQQWLLQVEIPRLQQWLPHPKPIQVSDRWLPDFPGLILTTPDTWLHDRLWQQGRFPAHLLTLIDGVDDLETWARQQLTQVITPSDWEVLHCVYPAHRDRIRDTQAYLTKVLYHHPANPYDCYGIDREDQVVLVRLQQLLSCDACIPLPSPWGAFFQQFQHSQTLLWAELNRSHGQFTIACAPAEIASVLSPVWLQQPTVLIGSALDLDSEASIYRQILGLGDLTCLKFNPDRQEEGIHLYQPDGIPMPNTPQFQTSLLRELRYLLQHGGQEGLAVVVVGDTPLKAQVGSALAAEFGSRVQVERLGLEANGILVTGWEFWQRQQMHLPTPTCLAIATLPIPSLEHPLVAGRVSYYKQQRQDWFRLYLLPTALMELQRAIAPLRESQGLVALLDSRVLHRSYGQQVLAALSPFAKIQYLDQLLPQDW